MITNMSMKHVLAAAAAGALIIGAAPLSAGPLHQDVTAMKAAASNSITNVHYRTYRKSQARVTRGRNWNAAGPLALPSAAAGGAVGLGAAAVGTGLGIASGVVGGTAAAVTGYPYGYASYGNPYGAYGAYGYAPDAYGSYAYSPGYNSAPGFVGGRDIGHSYYNGFGSPEPASQDNCAVDAGYGKKDYSQC